MFFICFLYVFYSQMAINKDEKTPGVLFRGIIRKVFSYKPGYALILIFLLISLEFFLFFCFFYFYFIFDLKFVWETIELLSKK